MAAKKSAPMIATAYPGIFERRGARGTVYVVKYRDLNGRQTGKTFKSLTAARKGQAKLLASVEDGTYAAPKKITLHAYAREWIAGYQGRSERGVRDRTRREYARDLERYPLRFFAQKTQLAAITKPDVKRFVTWLADPGNHDGQALTPRSVRRILAPLQACLATAEEDGLIRGNPANGIRIAKATHTDEDEAEERVRVLTPDELAVFLGLTPSRYRLMFDLFATTGLRASEMLGLQWADLQLDGSDPHLRVRRAYTQGEYGPPKSRYGRRAIPIAIPIADRLRTYRATVEYQDDTHPVFAAEVGRPLQYDRVRRALVTTAQEAGVSWMTGMHTLRHTFASALFARGDNIVQVSRRMGHHSPEFTLKVYVHLLPGDIGAPLELAAIIPPIALETVA